MFVSEADKVVLFGDFGEVGIPEQDLWLLRHFPVGEPYKFCCYFLKMRLLYERFGCIAFFRGIRDHLGVNWSRSKVLRWLGEVKSLERRAREAVAKFDLAELARIKLPS